MEDCFDYARLCRAAEALGRSGERFSIGRSAFGREIPCVVLGSRGPRILLVAGHHAREHISSEILFSALTAHPPQNCRAAAVLSANPDGAELCLHGAASAPREVRGRLLGMNGSADFSLWKANGRGVDLNVNFPARFGEGRGNHRTPGPRGCVGPHPLSEPENLALLRLIQAFRPAVLLTFHAKGEVIYWRFGQRGRTLRRDRGILRALCGSSGFAPAEAPHSTGGLKDFAVQYLGIPAFTVELGPDSLPHPLPYRIAGEQAARIAEFPDLAAAGLSSN